jgi:hypothetical protein
MRQAIVDARLKSFGGGRNEKRRDRAHPRTPALALRQITERLTAGALPVKNVKSRSGGIACSVLQATLQPRAHWCVL